MSRRRGGGRDVAIVGLACRFPGAPDLATFAAHLLAGTDPLGAARPGATPPAGAGGATEESLVLGAVRLALRDAGLPDGPADGRRVEVVVARGDHSHRGALAPFDLATIPAPATGGAAGRVGDRPDRRGVGFVVDAGGASCLVALDLAARSLLARRADLAIIGAVDLGTDVGSLPAGEEVGAVVLKRRADAERAGDRIYAVVAGVGLAADDREVGRAAPGARGIARAIRRAYRAAAIDPGRVALIAGHGSGSPAADHAERRALRATFPPARLGRRVLGAVVAPPGIAPPAAGMAGLIEAAVALHHRVLPRTPHAADPRPWVHGATDGPRVAGVNAVGRAGINAHAVLTAHPSSDAPDAPGALHRWPTEAFLLAGLDRRDLADRAADLARRLAGRPDIDPTDLASTLNAALDPGHPARLGIVAADGADLIARLAAVVPRLRDPAVAAIRDGRGAYFWDRAADAPAPRLAFLFPGEGSQYPGMLGDLAPHFPEVRALLDTSDRLARAGRSPEADAATPRPSELLYGPADPGDAGLWSAEVGVNVVLSAQWALYQLLLRLKIVPDAVVGHSSGEFLALAAAGCLTVDQAFEDGLGSLGAVFGRLEAGGDLPSARLVALATHRERVEASIAAAGRTGTVAVAMDNCPHQVVVAGPPEDVAAVVGPLRAAGVPAEDLPFHRAYHTAGFAPALGPIRAFFDRVPIRPPGVPIVSCATGATMPADPAAIRDLAVAQWTRCVAFRAAIEGLHRDGIDTFIDVGARGNLAGFVEDTLRGRTAFAVAANLPRRPGPTQLNHLVASLFARGINLDPSHLVARRRPMRVDLDAAPVRANVISPGDGSAVPEGPGCEDLSHAEDFDESAENGDEAAAVLLDFQRTMADFLAAQESVMASFLGGLDGAGDDPTDDGSEAFPFHLPAPDRPPAAPSGDGPWAGDLVALDPGRSAVAVLRLDAAGDPVAEHHTLGGRRVSAVHPDWRGLPILPFSVMAEMLAEGAARLAPLGWPLSELRDVRAHRWIRYEEDGSINLEVRAGVDPGADPDRVAVRVAIHNRSPIGRERAVESAVFEGVAVFAPAPLVAERVAELPLLDARPCRFTAESIYSEQWLFHGPALRAVAGIGAIGPGGIDGNLRVLPRGPLLRDAGAASRLRTDPIALDNFTHLLGAWGLDELADRGDVIFPLRMESLTIAGEPPADGTLVACRVRIEGAERHRVRARAELVRPDGTVWMAISGWEDWRFHWPGRYRDGFRHPDRAFLGEPLTWAGLDPARAAAVVLEPPADMARPVWRDVLEHVQLGPDERAELLDRPDVVADPGPTRTHHLWGRIAAKEAARRIDAARGRAPTYPADLIVAHDEHGHPLLIDRRDPARPDLPRIAIARAEGVVVALAVRDPAARPGVAVASIVDPPTQITPAGSPTVERDGLDDRSHGGADPAEWRARHRSVREALASTVGGPVDPAAVEVAGVVEYDAETGVAVLAARLRGERPIRVISGRRGDFAWAATIGEGVTDER